MKSKKILAYCLIFIFSSTCAFSYTNEQLQGMLELNNVPLNKAKNIVDLAGLDAKDARASFQPKVEFSATGTYLQNPPIDEITFDTQDIISSIMGSLGQSGAGLGKPYTIYDGMDNTLYNFSVKITQPLFTWGKLTTAVKIYDNVELVRNLQKQLLKNQLACELKARQSGVYYIKKMMANLDKQNIVALRLLEISEDAQKNGVITKQEALDAQLKAKSVSVGLKKLKLELNNQLVEIRTLVGNPDLKADDIEFIPDEDMIKDLVESDWNELLAKSLSPTHETFSMLSLLEQVSSQTKEVAQNSLYWNPDVALQVEIAYYGSYFPFIQKGFSEKDDYLFNLTIAINDTIWDGGKAMNDVARKVINENDAYLDKEDARNQIVQKLNEALVQMDYCTSNIEFKELSESFADEKIKQKQSMMDEGYGNETAVLLAKIEKYGYELEALQEKITRVSNYYTVEYLVGK